VAAAMALGARGKQVSLSNRKMSRAVVGYAMRRAIAGRIGAASGGRTHDIRCHRAAFCH
jgi:hypothetical protein